MYDKVIIGIILAGAFLNRLGSVYSFGRNNRGFDYGTQALTIRHNTIAYLQLSSIPLSSSMSYYTGYNNLVTTRYPIVYETNINNETDNYLFHSHDYINLSNNFSRGLLSIPQEQRSYLALGSLQPSQLHYNKPQQINELISSSIIQVLQTISRQKEQNNTHLSILVSQKKHDGTSELSAYHLELAQLYAHPKRLLRLLSSQLSQLNLNNETKIITSLTSLPHLNLTMTDNALVSDDTVPLSDTLMPLNSALEMIVQERVKHEQYSLQCERIPGINGLFLADKPYINQTNEDTKPKETEYEVTTPQEINNEQPGTKECPVNQKLITDFTEALKLIEQLGVTLRNKYPDKNEEHWINKTHTRLYNRLTTALDNYKQSNDLRQFKQDCNDCIESKKGLFNTHRDVWYKRVLGDIYDFIINIMPSDNDKQLRASRSVFFENPNRTTNSGKVLFQFQAKINAVFDDLDTPKAQKLNDELKSSTPSNKI